MKLLNKKSVIAAVSIMVLGSILYFFLPKSSATTVEESKETAVRKGTLQIDMQADGKSDISNVKLKFSVNGILKNLPVKPGDRVKKGQLIAQLDSKDFEYELASAKANYQAALAKLGNTENQIKSQSLAELNKLNNAYAQSVKDKREYEAMIQATDAFSKEEIELKRIAMENSERNYEVAKQSYSTAQNSSTKLDEASIAQAKAALEKAQKNLEDAALRSPVDGTVLALNYKLAETVSSNNDFAVISDGGGLEVNAQVLEMDIKDVFFGQDVEVEFESVPSKVFSGKVTFVESLPVNDSNGVVAYNVDIILDKPDENIKSGTSCVVTFIVARKKDVLIIPNEAVKVVSGKQVVAVKDKQGNPSTKQIKTGFTDGTNVEVVNGLELNDVVIINKPPKSEK